MTVNLTLENVVKAAEEIVSEAPAGYIYPTNLQTENASCLYVRDGRPDCIVGKILDKLGVPLDFDEDDSLNVDLAYGLLRWLEQESVIEIGESVVDFLSEIQSQQDMGVTWSRSLELAKDRVGIEE